MYRSSQTLTDFFQFSLCTKPLLNTTFEGTVYPAVLASPASFRDYKSHNALLLPVTAARSSVDIGILQAYLQDPLSVRPMVGYPKVGTPPDYHVRTWRRSVLHHIALKFNAAAYI